MTISIISPRFKTRKSHYNITKTLEQRFWEKVDKTGDCWNWTGSVNNHGYGKIFCDRKLLLSHRVSWEFANGKIPKGKHYKTTCILHRCDNPKCVNPDHLFLGTQKDNVADMLNKNRAKTKLNPSKVTAIRKKYAIGTITMSKLATMYGISQTTIWLIVNRKTWNHAAK